MPVDDRIGKLILSNPNGMLFDGANITVAGDVMLTTQAMGATFNNGAMQLQYGTGEALQGVVIKDLKNIDKIYPTLSRFNYCLSPNIQVMLAGIYRKTLIRSVLAITTGSKI